MLSAGVQLEDSCDEGSGRRADVDTMRRPIVYVPHGRLGWPVALFGLFEQPFLDSHGPTLGVALQRLESIPLPGVCKFEHTCPPTFDRVKHSRSRVG